MSHIVFLRPDLHYSSETARAISTANTLLEAGAQVTFITAGGSRESAALARGIEIIKLDLVPASISRPFLGRRLVEILERIKPTSLHVSAPNLTHLGALAKRAASRLNLPYVLEAAAPQNETVDFDPDRLRAIIVSADFLIESLVNRGALPRNLMSLLPDSPDDESRPDSFDHPGPCVIGCTGSFNTGFDGGWFLDAAKILVNEGKPWRFVMLGEGPNEASLRRRARESGIASAVTIGVPTTKSALATLSSLDIHVSCRTDSGPGWLALQTMRLGIPGLFAAAGDAFTFVQDQRNGILIQPGDARRLADEISSLIANPEKASNLGKAGRRTSFERSPRTAFDAEVLRIHGLLESEVS